MRKNLRHFNLFLNENKWCIFDTLFHLHSFAFHSSGCLRCLSINKTISKAVKQLQLQINRKFMMIIKNAVYNLAVVLSWWRLETWSDGVVEFRMKKLLPKFVGVDFKDVSEKSIMGFFRSSLAKVNSWMNFLRWWTWKALWRQERYTCSAGHTTSSR